MISNLIDLEYIDTDGGSSPFFPCLTELKLSCCLNLRGWWRRTCKNRMTALLRFPCLSDLKIYYCPNLTSMPLLPSLGKIDYRGGNVKSLEQIVKMSISVSQSNSSSPSFSSHSPPLSKIEHLKIHEVEDLEFLPESLCNLTSLQQLSIANCPTLSCADNVDIVQWQGLKNLQTLSFQYLPNFISLPKGLVYVTTVHYLMIIHCPKLMSLPEGMDNLTALQYLTIYSCPHLLERCKKNVGEDWPKIAHIPNITI